MPTSQWFQENPKISAYISKDLYQQLEEWMNEQGVKKVSQALTQILEDYLRVNQDVDQSSLTSGSLYSSRLDILEGKLKASPD